MCAVVAAVDEVDDAIVAVKESFIAEDLVLMLEGSDMIKRDGSLVGLRIDGRTS